MANLTLALDLEGDLITNAISQYPRSGVMAFLLECETLFSRENVCIFTTVDEKRFRDIENRLVADKPGFQKSVISTGLENIKIYASSMIVSTTSSSWILSAIYKTNSKAPPH